MNTSGQDDTSSDEASETEIMQALRERDEAIEMADRLAARIAPIAVIGEHTSHNDPWQNALDYDGPPSLRPGEAYLLTLPWGGVRSVVAAPPEHELEADVSMHGSPEVWICRVCALVTTQTRGECPGPAPSRTQRSDS